MHDTTRTPDDWITAEEAAIVADTSTATIWRWARAERLRRQRWRARTLFSRAETEAVAAAVRLSRSRRYGGGVRTDGAGTHLDPQEK